MTREARKPCRKRLRASLPLSHATVLVGFPRKVSDRLRGLSLSTSPFSERNPTRAYAAHQEMPTIYDLLRLWGTVCCPTLIVFRAISTDDFDAWMLPEPFGKGFSAPVFKQLDWPVRLSIDQYRSIGVPSSKSEIVNAQDAGSW